VATHDLEPLSGRTHSAELPGGYAASDHEIVSVEVAL